MTFSISRDIYDAMLAAATTAAPLEACGLLGGVPGRAERFYELTNACGSGGRFSLIPAEQFDAVRDMRRHGASVVGIWHSHPTGPPRMSAEDIRLAAMPGVAHVIVSLTAAPRAAATAWRVQAGEAKHLEIIVADD